jgi:hypothetical protein
MKARAHFRLIQMPFVGNSYIGSTPRAFLSRSNVAGGAAAAPKVAAS